MIVRPERAASVLDILLAIVPVDGGALLVDTRASAYFSTSASVM